MGFRSELLVDVVELQTQQLLEWRQLPDRDTVLAGTCDIAVVSVDLNVIDPLLVLGLNVAVLCKVRRVVIDRLQYIFNFLLELLLLHCFEVGVFGFFLQKALQLRLSLFKLTHSHRENSIQYLAFKFLAEQGMVFEFLDDLLVRHLASPPPVQEVVAHRIVVLLLHRDSFLPEFTSLLIVSLGEQDVGPLVVHVCAFAHVRLLHFVETAVEKSLVVGLQNSFDIRQPALALTDAVDVDALDQHLDEGCGLGELGPGEGQGIERDAEVGLARAADHELQNADTH